MKQKMLSEDDLRSKVVYQWLKDCGFANEEISIEYGIRIRLGKGVKTIQSRSDVVVRRADGTNLLIVEVKRPGHILDQTDRDQGLSYARSLAEGGIAPFTIVTNGADTQILDSVTGANIESDLIPPGHPYVVNGFKVSGDALAARAEALEYLISLSAENLLIFCGGQVQAHMERLRSDDPFSERKYIPALYADRKAARLALEKLLHDDQQDSNIILVTGPPQHGKTCFICHTAEQLLERGIPCLFYPAVGLSRGLMAELQDDFQWAFAESQSAPQIIGRLQRLAERIEGYMVIIIDGWNELDEKAAALNDELARLQNTRIKVVLSATSPSLGRLLADQSNNSSFVARAVNLSDNLIKRLSLEPLRETEGLRIVQIGRYTPEELREAEATHARAFSVTFPESSTLPFDPFYLRIAAEQFAGIAVPVFATRTDLLRCSISNKAARRAIGEIELFRALGELGNIILQYDTPFDCTYLMDELGSDNKLARWTDGGILMTTNGHSLPQIDFYYTHDKSFTIAVVCRKWHEVLLGDDAGRINTEIDLALRTSSGLTALGWFLSCPEYAAAFRIIFSNTAYLNNLNPAHLKVFSAAILNQVNYNANLSFDWLDTYIDTIQALPFDHADHLEEISAFIYALLKSTDSEKEPEKYRKWMRWLVKMDDSKNSGGMEESFISKLYGEEDIRSYDGYGNDMVSDFDIGLFEELLTDPDFSVAETAAYFLAYVCRSNFLEKVNSISRQAKALALPYAFEDVIVKGCESIISELYEVYYGTMCPGMLSDAEKGDEYAASEFFEQKKLWFPVLAILKTNTRLYTSVMELLKMLAEYLPAEGDEEDSAEIIHDPNQLTLNFPTA